VCIGLTINKEPVVGVVFNPFLDQVIKQIHIIFLFLFKKISNILSISYLQRAKEMVRILMVQNFLYQVHHLLYRQAYHNA
jgi:hypothetical protein